MFLFLFWKLLHKIDVDVGNLKMFVIVSSPQLGPSVLAYFSAHQQWYIDDVTLDSMRTDGIVDWLQAPVGALRQI